MMFGDTLIGSVKPGSDRRSDDTVMINNSCCIVENGTPTPGQVRFQYNTDAGGVPQSLVAPDADALKLGKGQYFFWLQDALVSIKICITLFPLSCMRNPKGSRGICSVSTAWLFCRRLSPEGMCALTGCGKAVFL